MKIGDLPLGTIWWLEDNKRWKISENDGKTVTSYEADHSGHHGPAKKIKLGVNEEVFC